MQSYLKIGQCTLFLIASLFPQFSHACLPPLGDNWFTSKIEFHKDTLPVGVTANTISTEYEWYVEISNSSDIPFYIVKNNVHYYKLVSGDSFYRASEYQYDKLYSSTTKSGVKLDGNNLRELEIPMVIAYGDDRPDKTKVPPAELFSLKAYYGTNPITVTGRISYTLNENYDNDRSRKGAARCSVLPAASPDKDSSLPMVLGLVGVIAIGSGFLLKLKK